MNKGRGLFLFTLAMTVVTASVLMYEPQASQIEVTHAEPVMVPYLNKNISEVKNDRQNRNVIGAEHPAANADHQESGGYSAEYGEDPAAYEEPSGAVLKLVGAISDEPGDTSDPVLSYLGNYTITFYCACPECCGEWATGCTASGVAATEWHTVATGEQFEFGTELYIDGLGTFTVEDRGVDGEWIDVYVADHQQALILGMQYRDVYLVE